MVVRYELLLWYVLLHFTDWLFSTRTLCYCKDDRAMHLIYECPVNAPAKFEVRTSPVPEIIAIGVLVGGYEP